MEDRTQSRHSHGLDQFLASIQGQAGLSILDLAAASQSSVSFITSLGHKIYSEDILRSLDSAFGDGDYKLNQADPARIELFWSQSLDHPADRFDGALVWDTLQFLSPPLLETAVARLHKVMRPGAYLLAFFHADEKAQSIPVYSYRIADAKTIVLGSRGQRRTAEFFNNRTLEKLFQDFHSVKFFLTRDHLREVIVRR